MKKLYSKLIIILALSSLITISCTDFSNLNKRPLWKIVGGRSVAYGPASHVDITIDTDGWPIVAYRDEEYGGLAVKKFNGSEWNLLGGPNISGSEIYYTNIEMAGATPVVAFKDMGSDSLGGRLSVMRYQQGEWEFLGKRGITDSTVDEYEYGRNYNNVLLTSADESLIYTACNTASSSFIFQWDGSEWTAISSGLPNYFSQDNDMIAADMASLYYVYNDLHDLDEIKGVVKRWDGTHWSDVGSQNGSLESQSGYSYSIKVFDNIPYIAFSTNTSQFKTRFSKAVVKKFDGSDWQFIGDSTQTDPYAISDRISGQISLSIDDTENMYLCYSDWSREGSGITAHHYDGTKWRQLDEKRFNGEGAYYIRMVLSGSTPYIVYQSAETLQAVVLIYDPL